MAYISVTEQTNIKVDLGRVLADSKLIKGIINRDRSSVEKKEMVDGEKYYKIKHDVLNKDFRVYYVRGAKKISLIKANNKVISPFYNELVDQKADYILGKKPTIANKKESDKNKLTELITRKFFKFLKKSTVGASNKGIEWGHVFVNEKGEFDFIVIPAEQIIPDYDSNYKNKLLSIMRYYYVDAQDSKGNLVQRTKVEIWDDKQVTFYIEDEKGEYIKDGLEPENPRPHWREVLKQNKTVVSSDAKDWGEVPFFPLLNNDISISDLRRVKTLNDLYDVVLSGFGNQIEDLKEIHVVIKNYAGTDNEELVQMFKESNFIKVSGDGGAEPLELTIPVAAKESIMKILKENIYIAGRGVDYTGLALNNPTNLTLKFMFARLDLKADAIISSLEEYILKLIEYWYFFNNSEYKEEDFEITFNKSLIINESEIIADVANSTDVSERTRLAHHPWVDDVDKEIEQKRKEEAGNVNLENVVV